MTRQLFIQSEFGDEEIHDSVNQFIDQKELRIAIEKALEKLPPRQREVYTLFKLEGLSYKEIQDRLNISKPAVNRLIQEAGKKMKEYLQPIAYIFLACGTNRSPTSSYVISCLIFDNRDQHPIKEPVTYWLFC